MTVRAVLEEAYRRGIELRADPDRNLVLFRPREAVDDQLRAAIREHKPALLEALQAERARGAAVDAAWDRLIRLHERCSRPRDWFTPEVGDAEEHVRVLWLAARKRPPFGPDFYEALETWERLAADAIRQAAETEEAT